MTLVLVLTTILARPDHRRTFVRGISPHHIVIPQRLPVLDRSIASDRLTEPKRHSYRYKSALFITPPLLMTQHPSQCYASSILHDATNTNLHTTGKRSVGYMQPCSTKRVTFPTSSARSQVSDAQLQKLLIPRLSIIFKALPTISMSSTPRSHDRGLDLNVREPELPYLRGVVPFPYSLLDSGGDIEMLDGIYYPRTSNTNAYSLPSSFALHSNTSYPQVPICRLCVLVCCAF